MRTNLRLPAIASTLSLPLILWVAPAAAQCDLVMDVAMAAPIDFTIQSSPTPDFIPGELIIKLKSAPTMGVFMAEPPSLDALGGDATLQVDTSQPMPPGQLIVRVVTFAAQSEESLKALTVQARDELAKREDVEFVQLNYILSAQGEAVTADDPCYALQWHYHENGPASAGKSPGGIGLPIAWQVTTGGPDVVVAVIDTGQTLENDDINPASFVAGFDFVDKDSDPTDVGPRTGFHGSHVSGTIGSLYSNNKKGATSENWELKIQPIRVLGGDGRGSLTDIANAIVWASGVPLSGVPANKTPARVINLSLGGPVSCQQTPSLQDAINTAHQRGTLVIAAAGNDHMDADNATPAGCDNVFTVSAGDAEGSLVTRYSNFGAKVEILAPGGDLQKDANGDGFRDGVLSSIKGGFVLYNGTSMAAPHVAGVAALVLSEDPALAPDAIQQKIMDKALPRTPAECPKPCGKGLLNADLF